MCEFKSAWVRRDGTIFESPYTDSHDEIAAIHGLKDSRVFLSNFAKVEFRPIKDANGVPQYLDLDAYTLVVDEAETPIWFNDDLREQVTAKLRSIVESYIVNDRRALVYGGMSIITDGADVDRLNFGRAAIIGGTVGAIRGGTVRAIWGGTVGEIWGGTVGEIRGGTVGAIWGGTVRAIWGGTVGEILGGTVGEIRGGTVDALWGGTVRAIGKYANVLADHRTPTGTPATAGKPASK